MGREAAARATVGRESADVKALLEGQELILRGALRRRWPLQALAKTAVDGGALVFEAGGEAVRLELGAAEAAAWAKKITTPPPTLAAKLGVGAAAPAFVCGPLDDAELAAALQGATTADPKAATQLVAVVLDRPALATALKQFARLPAARHAWLVYAKGKAADPGDAAIREAWRAAGCNDTKTCAVSATLTATRYSRPARPARPAA